eukprot:247316-Amphidinium_carterae.1
MPILPRTPHLTVSNCVNSQAAKLASWPKESIKPVAQQTMLFFSSGSGSAETLPADMKAACVETCCLGSMSHQAIGL